MSLWIDFFRGAEKVMAHPCVKPLDEARIAALEGLILYKADRAVIRLGDQEVAVLIQDA
jgi:hypothetical protein